MAAPRFHRLAVGDKRQETADAVSLAFAVPERLARAYRFRPGQYLTLRATIDGEDIRRSYSICSGLDDYLRGGELRIVVKRVAGGVFSNHVAGRLKPGDGIEVMTPAGQFTLLPDPGGARTLAAVACGSGITPVMSLIKTILARENGLDQRHDRRDSRTASDRGQRPRAAGVGQQGELPGRGHHLDPIAGLQPARNMVREHAAGNALHHDAKFAPSEIVVEPRADRIRAADVLAVDRRAQGQVLAGPEPIGARQPLRHGESERHRVRGLLPLIADRPPVKPRRGHI